MSKCVANKKLDQASEKRGVPWRAMGDCTVSGCDEARRLFRLSIEWISEFPCSICGQRVRDSNVLCEPSAL
jgi:hypothetical protein